MIGDINLIKVSPYLITRPNSVHLFTTRKKTKKIRHSPSGKRTIETKKKQRQATRKSSKVAQSIKKKYINR